MDDLYAIHSPDDYSAQSRIALPENILFPVNHQLSYSDYLDLPDFGSPHLLPSAVSDAGSVAAEIQRAAPVEEQMITDGVRTKIASHPLYPKLLDAYIDCQKVGAPPEIAYLLDEIRLGTTAMSTCYGDDPELDEFMDKYCSILVKYKSDLSRPFEEASSFLNKIETQLNTLCNGASRSYVTDEVANSSDEDLSTGETVLECPPTNEDRELKDKLLRKYSGYITALKQEFSKKKKKGKLPKEARQNLLDWWNVHYKWPYPTEADKAFLAESTGLDQKQINNWFINQRKRHWRPSENMQFAVMDNLYGPFLMKG